jgi:hypothetical protein
MIEVTYNTKKTPALQCSSIRVISRELSLDRKWTLGVEKRNDAGRIIDRDEIVLNRGDVREFLNSDTPQATIKAKILAALVMEEQTP